MTITAADTLAVPFRGTSNSSAMIVSIPARARMRPAHQLARAQHQLAGRDVGAPDPLLNSAAVERRLRRAVQRGKITGTGHIWGRSRNCYRGATPRAASISAIIGWVSPALRSSAKSSAMICSQDLLSLVGLLSPT